MNDEFGESKWRKMKNVFCVTQLENVIWRPPSLSDLPPMILDMQLTHLG